MTEIPVYSECVIGYRQWMLADWVLTPVSVGHPWRPGVNHAKCQPAPNLIISWGSAGEAPPANHAAPHKNCDCGLYALHEPAEQLYDHTSDTYVLGAVAAWGDLRVHHDGFRAEYAQIVALAAGKADLTEVANLYGVPVVPRDLLALEAERHGQPLPLEIRPEKPERNPDEYVTWGGYTAQPYMVQPAMWSVTWSTTNTTALAPPAPPKKRKASKKNKARGQLPRAPKNIPPRGHRS